MNNERFTVPEILFHPSDIGMNQAGLPEAIIQSVEQSNCFDDEEKQLLYDSVVLTGGNSLLKNYRQRMTNELRSLIPQDYDLNVFQPHKYVCKGVCASVHVVHLSLLRLYCISYCVIVSVLCVCLCLPLVC